MAELLGVDMEGYESAALKAENLTDWLATNVRSGSAEADLGRPP